MSVCTQLAENASAGVAPALRAVDCLANETAAAAFGRLFGTDGALLPALTAILTLYIAFFALSLLTGRSRIGISALTPRMMTLGLVLTFATSWVAYQGVVWTLATGAPDQIAGVLLGAKGSATQLFADRMDMIFAAIATVAGAGGQDGAAQGSFTPGNLMWLGTLLLMLGTVGVLVTARIALAVLLALGPVFVVLALFPGTRGLTAGWLRGVVMTAVTPLFVVLGGALMMELLVPVVASLAGPEGVNGRASMALFTIAAVHVALMVMVMKVIATMVSGWQVFGLAAGSKDGSRGSAPAAAVAPSAADSHQVQPLQAALPRSGAALLPASASAVVVEAPGSATGQAVHARTSQTVLAPASLGSPGLPPLPAQRGRGIGSHYRQRPNQFREMIR